MMISMELIFKSDCGDKNFSVFGHNKDRMLISNDSGLIDLSAEEAVNMANSILKHYEVK